MGLENNLPPAPNRPKYGQPEYRDPQLPRISRRDSLKILVGLTTCAVVAGVAGVSISENRRPKSFYDQQLNSYFGIIDRQGIPADYKNDAQALKQILSMTKAVIFSPDGFTRETNARGSYGLERFVALTDDKGDMSLIVSAERKTDTQTNNILRDDATIKAYLLNYKASETAEVIFYESSPLIVNKFSQNGLTPPNQYTPKELAERLDRGYVRPITQTDYEAILDLETYRKVDTTLTATLQGYFAQHP